MSCALTPYITGNLRNGAANADSYKYSHPDQYPDGTTNISTYFGPRRAAFGIDTYIPFGQQAWMKEYLARPVTAIDVQEADWLLTAHSKFFPRKAWDRIVNKHGGYLPLHIESVEEGVPLPVGTPAMQFTSTDPEIPWIGGWAETQAIRGTWYPSTVASVSYACKILLREAMLKSCDTLDGLPFKLHDFGARAATSLESAGLGGLSHIVNFAGTDTITAIIAAARWYGMTRIEDMPAYSIPAAEHSTITSWGNLPENERDAYRNMIRCFGGTNNMFAVVSDGRDLFNAIEHLWGGELRQEVIDNGGVLVIRPDSGDPVEVVRKALRILGERFGYSMNTKGYKLLPPYIRLIQGDGINWKSLGTIVDAVLADGWSLDNIAFGMGGGLLQLVSRDDQSWAAKASSREDENGDWFDFNKDPVTDPGKASRMGRLAVVRDMDQAVRTIRRDELQGENLLRSTWNTGDLLRETNLRTVRNGTGLWLPQAA